MSSDIATDRIRSFNRFYTRQIGLLDKSYASSGLSLPEARLLYELSRGATTAKALVDQLDMDPGYVSRILAAFQRHGLIKRQSDTNDRRVQLIILSDKGHKHFSKLDVSTRTGIEALLERTTPGAVADIVHAMSIIENGFSPARADDVVLRDLRTGDLGWIIHRQGVLYAQEFGWDASYEALVAKILAAFHANFDAAREKCWIADRQGAIVGSVFVVRESDDCARLRLLYVEPTMRGSGLGRRLVRSCSDFARRAGYKRMVLWTQQSLVAARKIYAAEGYTLVSSDSHHSFGVDLIGETWEVIL